jgi:hypothetical protein
MTRLVFHTHRDTLPSEPDSEIHVWLYGASLPFPHIGTIGGPAEAFLQGCDIRMDLGTASVAPINSLLESQVGRIPQADCS